jgi:hypothetical protein
MFCSNKIEFGPIFKRETSNKILSGVLVVAGVYQPADQPVLQFCFPVILLIDWRSRLTLKFRWCCDRAAGSQSLPAVYWKSHLA